MVVLTGRHGEDRTRNPFPPAGHDMTDGARALTVVREGERGRAGADNNNRSAGGC